MDPRRAKYPLAAGIVIAGLAIALAFRKPDWPRREVIEQRVTSPPLRQSINLADQPPIGTSQLTGQIEDLRPTTPSIGPATGTASALPAAGPPASATPPDVAEHFQPLGPPGSGQPSADPFQMAGANQQAMKRLPPPPAARRHTIRDGDTLASIAERYLGSSARQQEILELNPEVLTSAEVLPIGRVLRLPPGEPALEPEASQQPATGVGYRPPLTPTRPAAAEPPLAPVPDHAENQAAAERPTVAIPLDQPDEDPWQASETGEDAWRPAAKP